MDPSMVKRKVQVDCSHEPSRCRQGETPPVDILDQGSVTAILSHCHICNDDGSCTIKFQIETQRGTKINNIDYEDLKADAPITVAKYILSTLRSQDRH